MNALMLKIPIEATALPSVPVEILANEAKVMLAAGRAEMLVVARDGDELSAEFASINAARAAHSPVDDLGILCAPTQSIRAVAWMRSNGFAGTD